MSPTKRQLEALRFIRGYQQAKGRSPSLREIASGTGAKAVSGVFNLLLGLEERALIYRPSGAHRTIHIGPDVAIPRSPTGEPLYFVRPVSLPPVEALGQ